MGLAETLWDSQWGSSMSYTQSPMTIQGSYSLLTKPQVESWDMRFISKSWQLCWMKGPSGGWFKAEALQDCRTFGGESLTRMTYQAPPKKLPRSKPSLVVELSGNRRSLWCCRQPWRPRSQGAIFLGISPEKDLKWQFLFISYHLLLIPYFVIVGASRVCLYRLTLRWLELNTSGAFSEASPMVSPAASRMFLSSSWKILHA